MKTYTIALAFVQYSRAEVQIKATSADHALAIASCIVESDEVDDWNPVNGTVSVESVTEYVSRKRGRK